MKMLRPGPRRTPVHPLPAWGAASPLPHLSTGSCTHEDHLSPPQDHPAPGPATLPAPCPISLNPPPTQTNSLRETERETRDSGTCWAGSLAWVQPPREARWHLLPCIHEMLLPEQVQMAHGPLQALRLHKRR